MQGSLTGSVKAFNSSVGVTMLREARYTCNTTAVYKVLRWPDGQRELGGRDINNFASCKHYLQLGREKKRMGIKTRKNILVNNTKSLTNIQRWTTCSYTCTKKHT